MAVYPPDTFVAVRPFSHIRNGEEVTIGDIERQVFLTIPVEGLDILTSLAEGRTVGDSARSFEEKYAEQPDIDDFLTALESEGFLHPADGREVAEPGPQGRFWRLDWISQRTAQRLCSWPVVTLLLLITVAGIALTIADPAIIPPLQSLVFPKGNYAALTLIMMAWAFASVILHEVAHLVVARARGVDTHIGFGNVVYTLVAQTNMNGMWMVGRSARYLSFVYGLIVDAASVAILLGVVWADHQGLIVLSPAWSGQLVSALVFMYFLRISFQFFFYLRNDIYYVMATASGARNLMGDTEVFLRNGIARLLRRHDRLVDQSSFSRRERWSIRAYSVLYLIGRVFAIVMLVTVYLPLVYLYLAELFLVATGHEDATFGVLDVVVAAVSFLVLTGGGIGYWAYDMWRNRGRKTGSVVEGSRSEPSAGVVT